MPDIAFHWYFWSAIIGVAVAPRLFRRAWRGALQAAARCVSWGLCPLLLAVLVVFTGELLGFGSLFSLNIFDYESPFSGYGLAVTIGLSFGVLGSYIPALDFVFSAGSPRPLIEGDISRISRSSNRADNGHE